MPASARAVDTALREAIGASSRHFRLGSPHSQSEVPDSLSATVLPRSTERQLASFRSLATPDEASPYPCRHCASATLPAASPTRVRPSTNARKSLPQRSRWPASHPQQTTPPGHRYESHPPAPCLAACALPIAPLRRLVPVRRHRLPSTARRSPSSVREPGATGCRPARSELQSPFV